MKKVICTLVAALWLVPAAAFACIHAETDAETDGDTARPEAQEFVAAWADGYEVLILSATVEVSDSDSPLGLVTATPTLPLHYDASPSSIFEDLFEWLTPPSRGGGPQDAGIGDAGSDNGFGVHDTVSVGPYDITPIEVGGADGVAMLNDWLADHGFVTLDAEIVGDYAERGWFFLAVAIYPEGGPDATEGGTLDLPPLRLEFESEEVVVPLRMEAGMAPFDLRVTVLMPTAVGQSDVSAYGLEVTVMAEVDDAAPSSVRDLVVDVGGGTGWWATEIESVGRLNTPGNPIASWPSDFSLDPSAGTGDDGGAGLVTDGGSGAAGDTGVGGGESGSDSGRRSRSRGCSVSASLTPTAWPLGVWLLAVVRLRRSR